MLKDLKELTDGEIKVAISTVNMTLEVREGMLFGSDRVSTMASERLGYSALHHISQCSAFAVNTSLQSV